LASSGDAVPRIGATTTPQRSIACFPDLFTPGNNQDPELELEIRDIVESIRFE
jgi:hypothetical protein